MKETLEAVAAILGGTVMPGHGENTWFIVMGDPTKWETLKLFVHHAYGQATNMWRISYYCGRGLWKDSEFCQLGYDYREGRSLHINVNMTRPVEALTKDINKRLVIPSEKANVENVTRTQAEIDYDAKVLAFGREFGDMKEDERKVRIFANRDYSEVVELTYIGDTHAVLRADLSHGKMRKVINFIKEIVND
jgi:hypothetical protein